MILVMTIIIFEVINTMAKKRKAVKKGKKKVVKRKAAKKGKKKRR